MAAAVFAQPCCTSVVGLIIPLSACASLNLHSKVSQSTYISTAAIPLTMVIGTLGQRWKRVAFKLVLSLIYLVSPHTLIGIFIL